MRNGVVPDAEPAMVGSSTKDRWIAQQSLQSGLDSL